MTAPTLSRHYRPCDSCGQRPAAYQTATGWSLCRDCYRQPPRACAGCYEYTADPGDELCARCRREVDPR